MAGSGVNRSWEASSTSTKRQPKTAGQAPWLRSGTRQARKAVKAVTGKVKTWCRRMDTNQPLDVLLLRLNQMLRGWCAYFRPGVSSATFAYLSAYTWALRGSRTRSCRLTIGFRPRVRTR